MWASKFVWAWKGYAWSDEELDFFEILLSWKNHILVFDEIEKAYLPFQRLLLNLMNEGKITSLNDKYFITMNKFDSELKNYEILKTKTWIIDNLIIIFTSNVIRSYEEFRPMFLEDVDNKEEVDWTNLLFDNFYDY